MTSAAPPSVAPAPSASDDDGARFVQWDAQARAFLAQARPDRAAAVLTAALDEARRLPPTDPTRVAITINLGDIHLGRGDHVAAESLALELLASLPEPVDPTSEVWLQGRSLLGNAYVRAGRYDVAEATTETTIAQLAARDPTHPGLIHEYGSLNTIYHVTGRRSLGNGLLDRVLALRAGMTTADPGLLAEADGLIDRMREWSTLEFGVGARPPATPEEASKIVDACWRGFITRDYDRAYARADDLLHSPFGEPRWLLVWLTSARARGARLDVDGVLDRTKGYEWLHALAGMILDRGTLDAALAAGDAAERCMAWYYAGVIALIDRDEARARACFTASRTEGDATPDPTALSEHHQSGLELEGLERLAVPRAALSDDARARLAEAEVHFAACEFGRFAVLAHDLVLSSEAAQARQMVPETLLLQVAALSFLGQAPLADSVAAVGRKQLLHFPWHERLLDVVLGRQSHHRLRGEAGDDARAVAQLAYYGMLRMQIDGRWEEAAVLSRRVRQAPEDCTERRLVEMSDADPLRRAEALAMLATRLSGMGRYDLAEPAERAAVALLEAMPEPPPQAVARAHINLGCTLAQRGRHAEGLASLARGEALAATMDEAERALLDLNVGQVLMEVGDRVNARLRLHAAIPVLRRSGVRTQALVAGLNAVGRLDMNSGDLAAAIDAFEEALSRIDDAGDAGSMLHAIVLDQLAGCHQLEGRSDKAVALHREAREVIDRLLAKRDGPLDRRHFSVLTNLVNLAVALCDAGENGEARTVATQGLQRLHENADAKHELAYALKRALASIACADGHAGEALDWLLDAARSADHVVGETIALGNEELRLNYLAHARMELAALVPLAAEHFAGDAARLEPVLDVVLRRKCLAGEAAVVVREAVGSGRYPLLKRPLAELAEARDRLAAAALAGADSADGGVSIRAALRARVHALEAALADEVPELQIGHRLREVSSRGIVESEAAATTLVEFVRTAATGLGTIRAVREAWARGARYYAFVVPAGDLAKLRLVDLGPAAAIDAQVFGFVAAVSDLAGIDQPQATDAHGAGIGLRLRAALVDPLLDGLPRDGRIVVAADGALAKLPFEVLPMDDGGVLMERFRVSYVATLRDLAALPSTSRGGPSVVIGDPDFDLGSRGAAMSDEPPPFASLPGTRQEATTVASLLGIEPWLGGDALEPRLKRVESPRVLHIATHGFYAAEAEVPDADPAAQAVRGYAATRLRSAPMADAMHRSGLALAGANAAAPGGAPAEVGDGIVSAAEVLALDLRGTELVALSACETGLGELTTIEGVMGLRRAFLLAGARSVLVSLWAVPDEQTCLLMESFYRHLLKGASRLDALHAARAELRRRWPSPSVWGAFVLFGEVGPLRAADAYEPPVPHAAAAHVADGLRSQQAGRHAEACNAFMAAIKAGAPTPRLLIRLAVSLQAMNDSAQALQLLDRSIAQEPRDPQAWIERGNLRWKQQDWPAAHDEYTRAIALDPATAEHWYLRANVHAEMDAGGLAIADYTRAIDLDPRHEQAFVNRATIRMTIGEWDAALVDIEAALTIDPNDVLAQFHAGQLHAQKGSFAQARAALQPIARSGHHLAELAANVLRRIDDEEAGDDDGPGRVSPSSERT